MRRFRIQLAILLTLWALLPWAYATDTVDAVLERLYSSPDEAGGNYDLLMRGMEKLMNDNLRSPVAQIIHHRMRSVKSRCTDPAMLDAFYDELAKIGSKRGIPNGVLATQAQIHHRRALLRQGQTGQAAALKAYDAFAGKILVIGPFGFDTPALHDIAFPPEKALKNLGAMAGYGGQVEWRLIERDPGSSAFDLYERVYPRKGCCYGLYQFNCPEKAQILLQVSTGASAKIWFNGAFVRDIDRRKAYLPGSFLLPLVAAKGWNRILFKISTGPSSMRFRIMNRVGYPLLGIEEMGEVTLAELPENVEVDDGEFDSSRIDPLSFAMSHAALHLDDPNAAMALSDLLAFEGLESESIAEGERAISLAPESAHPYYLQGMNYRKAGYLPRNFKTNRASECLKQAIEINPEFLPARLELALLDHENDRSEEAIKSIRSILQSNPGYYDAWLELVSILDKMGWTKELIDAIREVANLAPMNPEPQMLFARYYQKFDRHDLAFEHLNKAMSLDHSRTQVLNRLAFYHWDRGNIAEALALYDRIHEISRSDFDRSRMATLQLALGDPGKARELYTELIRLHPGDPRYLVKLGDLALSQDGWEEAAEWYKQAVELSPDAHNLREALQDWKVLEDPLFEEYAVDEAAFTSNLPGKKEYPRASAICSLDHMITRIYPDGSHKSEIHQVFKILDKDAVEEFGRMQVPGRLETLKIIKPDGEVLEPVDAEDQGMFNLPGLDEGAVVVLKQTLFTAASTGAPLRLGEFYFQDTDCTKPFLLSRYVLAIPKGFDIRLERTLPERFEEERVEKENETIHIFTAKNVPVAEKENLMPVNEIAFPNVNLFQSRNWEQVAQIMANTVIPALKSTVELRKKAEILTEGVQTDLDRTKKIYDFVNEHVTEDQGSSMANSVLLEARGSRTALFMGLMDAAGIAYDYLRCGINPGYLGEAPDWSDVSQSLLPGDLVRIRPSGSEPVLLSFASRLVPFGEVPPQFFGAPCMKITGKPECIETLPGGNPISWMSEKTEVQIKMNDRIAKIRGQFCFPGYQRLRVRESLQRMDANNRKNLFEYQILRGIFPGARLRTLDILGVDNDKSPPAFSFELEAEDYVQPLADREGCKLLPVPIQLTRAFIRKGERKFPMIYRGYSTLRTVIDLDFGGWFEVAERPDSLVDRRFFLNYALIVTETKTGLRVERTVEFLPAKLDPEQYPELIEMLSAIDEREMEPIVLKRIKESANE